MAWRRRSISPSSSPMRSSSSSTDIVSIGIPTSCVRFFFGASSSSSMAGPPYPLTLRILARWGCEASRACQTPDMEPPAEMLAIAISKPGEPDVLRPVHRPVLAPRPGEVLIHVAAAGINAPDLAQRRGTYDPPPGASLLPGLEVSGEIAKLGEGVTSFSRGDQVVALTNGGGYAEYVTVPAGQVLPLPRGWSLLSGAALPETFFTVEQTLVMRAGLAAGMDVLIHGAAGGIGGAAIQIAKALGARP